ncbi:MAG TPA: radical SAM protein [Saprospiraceae bacterium]|nr:radical SAM protein [Saprospiraceae bacterium]
MKITLIKPSMGELATGYQIAKGSMEPLALAILAGLIGDTHKKVFYDDRLENIPFDEPTDAVCITVDSFSARRSYEIARIYRGNGVKVILGGVHVTLLPEEAMQYSDAIVVGDAEPVWKSLMTDLEKGKLKKIYQADFVAPQAGCFPDRSIFRGKKYLPVSMMQYSRGCKFKCTFCSVSKFFNHSYQTRKIDDVLYEIEKDQLKTILFVDDNMVTDKKGLKDFLRELKPLKVRWASQSSIDMVKDKELLRLMKDSGCIGNLIGFESINIHTLKWFKKAPNIKDFNQYKEVLEVLRDHGFLTWASFMIGNDFDTLDTIERTVEFAIKSKFTLAFFHVLMPYPGTEVFEQFRRENRLLFENQWWNHPDYRYNHAAFTPKLMTADDLTEATIKANEDFYSVASIAHRAMDTSTHLSNLVNMLIYARLNHMLKTTSV